MKVYRILSADSPAILAEAVNNHMKEGWDVAGGLCSSQKVSYVSSTKDEHWPIFLQAITKEAE